MSESKLIVMGDDVFEMPVDDMGKYKLKGESLSAAKLYISGMSGDVEGQDRTGEQSSSPSGSVYDSGRQRFGGKGY